MPHLILKYSSCCGRILCEQCINALFLRAKKASCHECKAEMTRDFWQLENLDLQRYRTEAQARTRANKTFRLGKQDFDTLDEFNDYLEMVQDIVCDLMGSKAEQIAAEKRIKEWEEQNKDRVLRAQRAATFKDERTQLATAQTQAATSTYDKNIMMLPTVLTAPGPKALLTDVKRPLADMAKTLAVLSKLPPESRDEDEFTDLSFQVAMGNHMAKLAGGWSADLDRRRALQEALALF